MQSPRISHLQAARRVLRYLKIAIRWRLHFKHQCILSLDAYRNSVFISSLIDHRSTTGYCIFLARNLITCRSKKQEVVAWSSNGVEFRALAHIEIMWIKGIIRDLKITMDGLTTVLCDNQSTIRVSHNPMQRDRMKHVKFDRQYIKEMLEQNNISIPCIASSE